MNCKVLDIALEVEKFFWNQIELNAGDRIYLVKYTAAWKLFFQKLCWKLEVQIYFLVESSETEVGEKRGMLI